MEVSLERIFCAALTALSVIFVSPDAAAQCPVVPGTGSEIVGVADDFEDPSWSYTKRDPKSTEDIDENQRGPMGAATTVAGMKGLSEVTPISFNAYGLRPAAWKVAAERCF